LDVFVSLASVPFVDVEAKQRLGKLALSQAKAVRKIATTSATATTAVGIDDHLAAP
jgi:hypothetical protein